MVSDSAGTYRIDKEFCIINGHHNNLNGGRRVTEGQLDRPRLHLYGAGKIQAGKTRCSPYHGGAYALDGISKNGLLYTKKDVRQPR